MKDNSVENPNNYIEYYNEPDFWDKIKNLIKKGSRELIEKSLMLFYCLKDNKTPKTAKAIIIGALGYLILPIDVIPDFIPVVGLVDDLVVISGAIYSVSKYIKEEHKEKAKEKADNLFKQNE